MKALLCVLFERGKWNSFVQNSMLNVATMRRRNSADNKIATRILFIQRLRLQETMHPHKSYELESIQTSLKFTGFRTIACTKTYQKIIFAQQA